MDEFVSIPDYEDYFINRKGEVLSKRRKKDGRIMKQPINSSGYRRLNFKINKKLKGFLVHRLLAKMFIPNPNNYEFVDHINRDRLDNRLENLRWCSRMENNQNQTIRKTNKSGYKHISWYTKRQRWCVEIERNKKKLCGHKFIKLEDAIEFRNKILTELGEEII
jgi:hypothetical protein